MSDLDLPRLADALLRGGPLVESLRSAALRPGVERAVAEIRSGNPEVVWWGRNGDRVDLTVRTAGDEWRIVYFTSDERRIDDLSIFQRPPVFDGVSGGCAVIVNGPSGSGKSSVLEQIAARSRQPWVIFDEPVVGSVDQGYLIWRDRADVLHRGFIDAIAALARRGNLVALSAAGHPQHTFDAAFEGVHVLRVGLDCDLPTLLAREHRRPGRWGGLAAGSVNDHDGWTYDLRLDAVDNSADEVADRILATLPTAP